MTTLLYTHPACIDHDPGAFHPESPDRLKAVLAALGGSEFAALKRLDAPKADREQIERIHDADYVSRILGNIPQTGLQISQVHLDPDTVLSPASGEAALRAAGGLCAAVDAVMTGEAETAFCAVRPPGHHAEAGRAMGFCLFNNIAIGAAQAAAVHGCKRVAMVDFDVHHGNGSQAAAERRADFFYASSHQFPAYPGSGRQDDRGPLGNIVNVELAPGSGSAEFRSAYEECILPALRDFAPDILLISAGFDGHSRDPLCQLELATADFAWLTKELMAVAEEFCRGRVVSTLEGGYDLEALAASTKAHVGALMGL
jgi:acetoin utilization deacetylase AcuC-like enzyme